MWRKRQAAGRPDAGPAGSALDSGPVVGRAKNDAIERMVVIIDCANLAS